MKIIKYKKLKNFGLKENKKFKNHRGKTMINHDL